MTKLRATRRALLALAAALPAPALAQAFPDRPIRFVIPWPPGGTNDIVGRLVSDGMAARLGQPIVIENRGGAGGALGAEVVAKATPDGYTMLLGGSGSLTINQLVRRRLPYDPATAFAPIGMIGSGANVIVVHPSVRATNLRELQAIARTASPPLNYASPGVGSTGHAAGALITQVLGVEMEHVPYRGTGPAMNDVVAGRIQVFTNALAPMQPQIAAGNVRPLAIAGTRRNAAIPDLPTTGEAGFPDIQAATWYALLATGGTPPDRVARLHAALGATIADPEIRRKLEDGGIDVEPSESPAAFAAFVRGDHERWAPVVRRAGVSIE
ncbi:tripartite tricarboxylate transporter substrate binding protein [Roseomonas sp. PWR1]|uniref:Tripartite tricarboxylate transporter substrate binding protein n=1 Tax=Roseomonas nitratireducens TaxID=2820810 RepID=A0ABS4ASV3_9PROT|nr:tripartite tricarboxylate transporter substrate-binding protein [Neoroseomonas nitratireducens]MBP0464431.1 tripartite tricarboxylate transporter substrate binding protein [Neoroseomonas nitratireducens]